MKLKGQIEIAAAPSAVWELLIDPLTLAGCVPGVNDVRRVDDQTFEGSITAQVGPMAGDFAFTSVITRADFPNDLLVQIHGVDSVTKSRLEADVQAHLVEAGSATLLVYDSVIKVRGRLAILGEMVLRATASVMISQVTKCLRTRLES